MQTATTFGLIWAGVVIASGVSVNCLHPGVINTPLLRRVFGGGHGLPDHSETLHYLAISPDVANVTDKFFDNGRVAQSNAISYDPHMRQRLW